MPLSESEHGLLDKVGNRSAVISVIGLGFVGLQVAVSFAEAGFRVVGVDIDADRIESLNRGNSYIQDISSEVVSRLISERANSSSRTDNAPRFSATLDFDAICDADVVVVCVPTPLSKTKDPDLSHIISAADEISYRLHAGMLIVLESTTYPGTTEEVFLPRLQSKSNGDGNGDGFGIKLEQRRGGNNLTGAEVGKDFLLAFSPERIDPGNDKWNLKNTPKVIGGITEACLEAAVALYSSIADTVVPVSTPKVAEMVKLLENTFRATNIALVNEFAIMCDHLGVDVWEVIEAAKTKPFGFMPFYPGLGLGGHCLPIDPEYLAWKLKTLSYNARFIQLASEINFGMPRYVLSKISDALNAYSKPLKGSRVIVLGITYKADVNDLRESPALDILQLLQEKDVDVAFHDPYVTELNYEGLTMKSLELTSEVLEAADCVVVATSHSSYDWNWILEHSKLFIDTKNVTHGVASNRGKVVKI